MLDRLPLVVNKKRLDSIVCEQCPSISKTRSQELIRSGCVTVDGRVSLKPGVPVSIESALSIKNSEPKFVSRAGFKLEAAFEHFELNVSGLVALDVGLSTGGFAHCLLMNGADKVYGVDVGVGQLHPKLRDNSRLVAMEQTDIRELKALPEPVDFVTLDLSFISVHKVLDSVIKFLKPSCSMVVLIKPQFEVGREFVGSGGIVTSDKACDLAVERVLDAMNKRKFRSHGVIVAPKVGAGRRNKEFLAFFTR